MMRSFLALVLALPLFAVACDDTDEFTPLDDAPAASGSTGAPVTAPGVTPSQPSPNGDQAAGTGSENNTQNHMEDTSGESNPNATNVDQKKQDEAAVGSTNIVARLHACGKISYDAMGTFLASRGVDLGGNGAGALYREGRLALGVPNYRARIAEAAFPSTAAFSKMFDIYALAAAEIRQNLATSEACPGTAATGEDGRLTQDAISCIIGVPATAEHVALANLMFDDPAYAERPEDAAELGIAALLSSHELCE